MTSLRVLRRLVYMRSSSDVTCVAAKKRLSPEERGEADELNERKIYTHDESVSVCVQHCTRLPPYYNDSSSFNAVPDRRRHDSVGARQAVDCSFCVNMAGCHTSE